MHAAFIFILSEANFIASRFFGFIDSRMFVFSDFLSFSDRNHGGINQKFHDLCKNFNFKIIKPLNINLSYFLI